MTDEQTRPIAGRRRRHKSPAVAPDMHDLTLPSLPDHLRADADGPSCSDEEKGAKRLRFTSTTPRSVRGTDPDEYDRVMGVTSVGFRGTVRFGEENYGSGEGQGDTSPLHANPPQIMNPNISQTLPWDSARVRDPSQEDTYVQHVNPQSEKRRRRHPNLNRNNMMSKRNQSLLVWEKKGQLNEVNLRSCHRSGPQTQLRLLTIRILVRAQAKLHGSLS